jgi:hypothetical protein
MQYSKFVVNEWPWCVWEEDLPNRNLELINSLDPTYFKYLANVHRQSFETGEHQQHAALALRTSYAHGLETFFAILFATIQAPDCVIGWLQKYDAKDLRQLIEKVQQGRPIRSKLRSQPHSWQAVAHMVLPPIAFQDTREQEDKIKEQFAASWARFAQDFLEDKSTQEYNSIKHGFRISNGGFSLSIGKADTWGIPAPPERMQALGGSEYGSSFFTAERIVDHENAENITPHSKHHFRVRRCAVASNTRRTARKSTVRPRCAPSARRGTIHGPPTHRGVPTNRYRSAIVVPVAGPSESPVEADSAMLRFVSRRPFPGDPRRLSRAQRANPTKG